MQRVEQALLLHAGLARKKFLPHWILHAFDGLDAELSSDPFEQLACHVSPDEWPFLLLLLAAVVVLLLLRCVCGRIVKEMGKRTEEEFFLGKGKNAAESFEVCPRVKATEEVEDLRMMTRRSSRLMQAATV